MKRHGWTILYSVALIIFTVYVLLDTFVITRVYSVVNDRQAETESDANGQNTSGTTADQESAASDSSATEPQITDSSYDDGQIRITITQYREHDTEIYAADITLSSAGYLKTALAQNSYGRNITEKTSAMAEAHDAVLAINGDYYGVQERGYVLRNGVLYRDTADNDQEDLVIYQDGSFAIISESDVSAQTLLEQGAEQILSFGPALAENGEIVISEEEEVGKAMASNPRTAIAILDDLHYLFLVSDGRTKESAGLSLYELASAALELGAQTVYNLDGGGSSTLWFNGEVINRPTSGGKIHERSVSDIVYIGY